MKFIRLKSSFTVITEVELFDISRIFTENNIDVKSMNVRTTKQERATITVGFETHGVEQLDRLISKLKSVESVNDIERSTNG